MRLLFVCLGNICRSPTAEAVMIALVAQRGLSEEITCDSAGTSGWHVGEQADARMRRHAEARGYPCRDCGGSGNCGRRGRRRGGVAVMAVSLLSEGVCAG